jgi:hypothetical protein
MSTPKPTIDFGYPTEPHGRIPAFNSIDEEAEFWDTHDFTDYLEESRPVEVEIGPDVIERLTVSLDRRDRDELRRRAKARGVAPATLARIWLEDCLRREAEAGAASR